MSAEQCDPLRFAALDLRIRFADYSRHLNPIPDT